MEWLSNPTQDLSAYQQDVDGFWPHLGMGDGVTSLTVPGTVALIPDQNTSWRRSPFPSPEIVSETRILVLYTSRLVGTADPTCRLDNSNISSSLPTDVALLPQSDFYYAFARVTYQAGASLCAQCRLSSPLTGQNVTQMTLSGDTITKETLWMMPDVINYLVLSNKSILSSWGNLDDYVSELLAHSYCGAWNGLHQWFGGRRESLISGLSITAPAIKARVDLKRAYAWLGTEILFTFFGIFFPIKVAKLRDPLVGDTSFLPFYLDASQVIMHKSKGILQLNRVDDRWKLKEAAPAGGSNIPLTSIMGRQK